MIKIEIPFGPEYEILYTIHAFKTCLLCEDKLKIDPKFNSHSCIHCEHKILQGNFKPNSSEASLISLK